MRPPKRMGESAPSLQGVAHLCLELFEPFGRPRACLFEGCRVPLGPCFVEGSETPERADSSRTSDQAYLAVLGGRGVTVRWLNFEDAPGVDLSVRCRVTVDEHGRPSWDVGACQAPLLLGDGADGVNVVNSTIDSHKAVLLDVRYSSRVSILNSQFRNASVFGVVLHNGYLHRDISGNEFSDIGANALVFSHVTGASVVANEFRNNHWDRQFEVCGNSGAEPCSGGQIHVRDQVGRAVRDVEIRDNLIDYTRDPKSRATVGIEVGDADRASITGLRIVGNRIQNQSRQAIQVHAGRFAGGHDVLIAGNVLVNNLTGFSNRRVPTYVTLNRNRGVRLGDNQLVDGSGATTQAAFLGGDHDCEVGPNELTCRVVVRWEVRSAPEGAEVRVLVDGELLGGGHAGLEVVAIAAGRDARLELYVGRGVDPVAVMTVAAKRTVPCLERTFVSVIAKRVFACQLLSPRIGRSLGSAFLPSLR